MMLEGKCSRLVTMVASRAVPTAPPRLRIMLEMPEAAAASGDATLPSEIALRGASVRRPTPDWHRLRACRPRSIGSSYGNLAAVGQVHLRIEYHVVACGDARAHFPRRAEIANRGDAADVHHAVLDNRDAQS